MSEELEEVGMFFERGSHAIHANALSVQPFDDSCIIIRHTFPSERKTKFDVGESFTWKILASIAKLSIAVLKDFLTTSYCSTTKPWLQMWSVVFTLFSLKEKKYA